MKQQSVKKLITAALFAALVCTATMVIRIPTPGTGGYVHPVRPVPLPRMGFSGRGHRFLSGRSFGGLFYLCSYYLCSKGPCGLSDRLAFPVSERKNKILLAFRRVRWHPGYSCGGYRVSVVRDANLWVRCCCSQRSR